MESHELVGKESATAAQLTFLFFFSQAITRNDPIFYESWAMKSEKATTASRFLLNLCRMSSWRQMISGGGGGGGGAFYLSLLS